MAVDIPSLTQFTIRVFAPTGGKIDPSLQAATTALFQRMADSMPWLPYNPASLVALAFQQGQYPYPAKNPPAAVLSQWPDRMTYWNQIADQFKPITDAVLRNDFNAAQQLSVSLNARADFWDTVSKYTGTDYIMGVWNKLWEAIAGLRTQRDAAQQSLGVANDVLTKYGASVPASLSSQTMALNSQFDSLTSRARSAIAVLGSTGAAEAGLGAAVVVLGIAAAAVIAITASVWAIAREFSAVQTKAASNAQDLLKWREQQDAADFAAGKITNDQLMLRREENVAGANSLVEAQGAAAVGGALGKAGAGVAMGIGAVVLAGLGAWFLLRKSGKSS